MSDTTSSSHGTPDDPERCPRRKRRFFDYQAVKDLVAANSGVLKLFEEDSPGPDQLPEHFTVRLRVATWIRAPGAPEPVQSEEEVYFGFGTRGYPEQKPEAVVHSWSPLFLPAVGMIPIPLPGVRHRLPGMRYSRRPGDAPVYLGHPCLVANEWLEDSMDLVFLVRQAYWACVVDREVLNLLRDSLNPEAAQWFIEHPEAHQRPALEPLREPPRPAAGPAQGRGEPGFSVEVLGPDSDSPRGQR